MRGPVAPRFHPSKNKPRQAAANLMLSFLMFRLYAFVTTGGSLSVGVEASLTPMFSKLITSGWYDFLDSTEVRAEGLAEGTAWRVRIEGEGEAATSTSVVGVIGEGGKE